MLFNSGEGAFQRMIELQNQRRLCEDKKVVCQQSEEDDKTSSTYLGHSSRISLHKRAQTPKRTILFLIVPDFIQSLTPSLGKFRQVGSYKRGVHQPDPPD